MPAGDLSAEEARQELIRLLEAEECRLTDKAECEGRAYLKRSTRRPTQWDVHRFALAKLKANFPLHAVLQGDPPGSNGIGYEMRNVDGEGLYIKLKIEDHKAWLISFHS